MKHTFRYILLTLVCLCAIMLTACEKETEAPYTLELRMSSDLPADHMVSIILEEVCAAVLEKTDGAVTIEYYPEGALSVHSESLERTAAGEAVIAVEDPAYLGIYVPDLRLLNTPMLYTGYADYLKVTASEPVAAMKEQAAQAGLHILSTDWIYDFEHLFLNRTIKNPKELANLVIGTDGGQLNRDLLSAWGMKPDPEEPADALEEIKLRRMQAMELTLEEYTALMDTKNLQYAQYPMLTYHLAQLRCICISQSIWQEMPEEYREILTEEFAAGAQRLVQEAQARDVQLLEELESNKRIRFSKPDPQALQTSAETVIDQMAADLGVHKSQYFALQELLSPTS